MPHFQPLLKSSLKLILSDIDLTINKNQIHLFILLIKSPVSHAADNVILYTGMIFRRMAEKKYRFLLISGTELKFHLLRPRKGNPEAREENFCCPWVVRLLSG